MLRCTWCCKDTPSSPCIHCGNEHSVSDPYQEHTHEWSRKTINTVECKVCDLEVDNAIYFSGSAPISGKKEKPEQKEKSENETKPEDKPEPDVQRGTESLPKRRAPRRRSSSKAVSRRKDTQ